jgi:hypothetical protein
VAEREDLVRELLSRFAHDLSNPLTRKAFDLLIVARNVTAPMLADVVNADAAQELFLWLRGLPFVEHNGATLQMHDFVRESFAAHWAARDPVQTDRTRTLAMQHVLRRLPLLGQDEVTQHLKDWFFLLRHTASGPFFDHRHLDSHYLDALDQARDPAPIETLVQTRLGDTMCSIVRHWLTAAPDRFMIVRNRAGLLGGVLLILELTALSKQDIAHDPVAQQCWDYMCTQRQVRTGGSVWLARLVLDAQHDTLPQPVTTLGAMILNHRMLMDAQAEWHFLVHHNVNDIAPAYATLTRLSWVHRVTQLDHTLDDRAYAVFARDLVAEPVPAQWRPPVSNNTANPISKDVFAAAVRDALRDYTREDRLQGNALLMRPWVIGDTPAQRAAMLRAALAQAVHALSAHPADAKFHHALRLTWLDPGATQEKVAEELGLPFNTYRYHLAKGTERVVQALWLNESFT